MVIILFTLDKWGMKIIRNIVTDKDWMHLEPVIGNGKMLLSIHRDGYHGIYYGKKMWSARDQYFFF